MKIEKKLTIATFILCLLIAAVGLVALPLWMRNYQVKAEEYEAGKKQFQEELVRAKEELADLRARQGN